MNNPPSDSDLWEAFVEAKREMHRCQAESYQNVTNRAEVLKAALQGGAWQRGAALDFLTTFSSDGLALLPQLVNLSTSDRSAFDARRAIGRISRDRLLPALEPLIIDLLDSADEFDYRRYAELLAHIGAFELLGRLAARALASDDPETREVGEVFTEAYGPMWLPRLSG